MPEAPYVLVVDDLLDMLDIFRFLLEEGGYQVETVENGHLALAKIKEVPPGLILLDMMMPDIISCELVKQIRENPTLPYIPIVLVAVAGSSMSLADAIAAGADDLICKPIDMDEMLGKVSRFLKPNPNDSLS